MTCARVHVPNARMDKQTPLTPRQEEALKIIAAKQATRRTGPTVREVAAAMGVAGNAVQGFVGKLRAAGMIEADAGFGLVCTGDDVAVVLSGKNVREISGLSFKEFARRAGEGKYAEKPLAKPGGKLL